MLTADFEIATHRGSHYLVQLCRHAASMASTKGHRLRAHAGRNAPPAGEVQLAAEWSDTDGVIRFAPWGRCTLQATANTLTVRIDARDESALSRIQDIITTDLQRIGRRERLIVTWRRLAVSADAPANGTGSVTPPTRSAPRRRGHRLPIVVTVAVGLVVAAHLGLGAVMLANLRWTVGTAAVVLVIIAATLLVILISRHSLRRRTAARRS
jgi:hypothetical protein